ncbi:UNVERIFIED_CONTAM: hypothetical protein Cloal_2533 [Acetivibrio alkalicellulosi]
MLNEKEYLLLCELSYSGLIDNDMEMVEDIIKTSVQNSLIEKIIDIPTLMSLKIVTRKLFEDIRVYVFENDVGCKYIIFVSDNEIINVQNELVMEIFDYLKENIGDSKCFITGMFAGGIYASFMALELNTEAILFGVPTSFKIEGQVKNYIGENEAVDKYVDKVIFVKQKETEDNIDIPYINTFIFDEKGNVVVGQQSDYSKFKSWVCYGSDTIREEIWNIFFEPTDEDESFMEKNIYSVLLKVNELDENKIINSIKDVIIYINKQLEKNRNEIKTYLIKNIDNIEEKDNQEKLLDITEEVTSKAVEMVNEICVSVETIIKGLVLFTIGKMEININAIIEEFFISATEILEKEKIEIKKAVENEIDELIYHQIGIPKYEFNDIN